MPARAWADPDHSLRRAQGVIRLGAQASIIARRDAELLVKYAAEVRRAVESPTETDFRDRQFRMQRTDQIGAAAVEASRAQVVAETVAGLGEQLLQIAARDPLAL